MYERKNKSVGERLYEKTEEESDPSLAFLPGVHSFKKKRRRKRKKKVGVKVDLKEIEAALFVRFPISFL